MPPTTYRYQFPKKAIKADCPDCSPNHRKTLSRYIDTQTGDALPEPYGRCDRQSNCGFHLSPYHKGPSGISYANEVYERWKEEHNQQRTFGHSPKPLPQPYRPLTQQPTTSAPVCTIPDEVFKQSLSHYERNQFAHLLRQHFGFGVADELLHRFQIGTSGRWPGACVFWYIDERGRKRGGQVKLFDHTFHTVKYIDHNGEKRTKTSWVHAAYKRRCDEQKQPYPAWLTAYLDERNDVQKSPCLFGLPQLLTASVDQPVAIVEAPKTAVLCTPYFPDFIWLAVGALSYLNAERLAPLRGRNVVLFPDLSKDGSALRRWSQTADQLRPQGFNITTSDYFEQRATDEERANGLDIADYLLNQWNGYPPKWDN